MRVERNDGVCRSCGGEIQVVEADDATMTVACLECSDVFLLEPDAFGDGCMDYYVPFLAEQEMPGREGA